MVFDWITERVGGTGVDDVDVKRWSVGGVRIG